MAALNSITLIFSNESTPEVPCVVLDATVTEDADSYIDIGPGHEPIYARVWLTRAQLLACPDGFSNGQTTCSIRITTEAYDLDASVIQPVTRTLSNAFRLVKASMARSDMNNQDLVEVLLATEQWWWQWEPITLVRNLYNAAKTEFDPSTASNETTPFTLAQVVGEITTHLNISPGSPGTFTATPNNIVAYSTHPGKLLARILRPFAVELVCDPFLDAAALSYGFVPLSASIGAGSDLTTLLEKVRIESSNGDVLPATFAPDQARVLFPKWPMTSDSTRYTEYDVFSANEGSLTGTAETLFVSDYFDVAGAQYTLDLQAIANERADIYFERLTIPQAVYVLAGAYALTPNNAIRRVKISIGRQGAITTVWTHGLYNVVRENDPKLFNKVHAPEWPEYSDPMGPSLLPRDDGTLSLVGNGGEVGFWARITGFTLVDPMPIGAQYRWIYDFEQVWFNDAYEDLSADKNGNPGIVGQARNTREYGNRTAPNVVWGVDITLSSYTSTAFEPKAVGGGGTTDTLKSYPIVWMRQTPTINGDPIYLFCAMGSHDGLCS